MIQRLLSILIFTTILFSPLYVVRWTYLGFLPTTLLEILVLATITVWGISKILRKDFSLPKTSFDKPILLFLIAAVISLFVTPDLRGGLGVFKSYIVEPILFFYILIDTFNLHENATKSVTFQSLSLSVSQLLVYALIFSGLWISLLGIAQVIFKIGIVTPHEAAAGRAHAVYNTGNALGLYVGPIFVLALGALTLKLKVPAKGWSASGGKSLKLIEKIGKIFNSTPFLLFSLFSFLFAILLSKSTGALIGLAAAIIFFLLFAIYYLLFTKPLRRITNLLFKISLAITIIIGSLFFLNISCFTPKVENPWERTSESTLIPRLCLWEGTKNMLFDRPIFGAGLSGFKELYSEKYVTCDAEPLEYPHNIFLNFWSEMGLVGLVAFICVLFTFFGLINKQSLVPKSQIQNHKLQISARQNLRLQALAGGNHKLQISNNKQLGPPAGGWCLVLCSAMVYWLIHGLVDVPYFKNDLALEFWVIIALAEILSRRQSLPCQSQ